MPPAADPALRTAFIGLLHGLADAHGLAPEDRDDLEQQVWLRAASEPPVSDPVSLLRALTVQEFSSAVAAARARDRAERATGLLTPGLLNAAASAEARVLAGESSRELRAAVSRLPARCPALVSALLEPVPLSYRELAAELDMPRGSIGPTRSRCLACLRRLLGPQLLPPRADVRSPRRPGAS